MEKKYIAPATATTRIELQQMIAESPKPELDPTKNNSGMDAKGFSFFVEEERAEKNEYKAYNLWED